MVAAAVAAVAAAAGRTAGVVAAAAPFHSEDKDPAKRTTPTKDPRGARPMRMDRKPQRSKGG